MSLIRARFHYKTEDTFQARTDFALASRLFVIFYVDISEKLCDRTEMLGISWSRLSVFVPFETK